MVGSVIRNIDVLKELFAKLIQEDAAHRIYSLRGGWDDRAKERAIEQFEDKEDREAFFKFFKQLQNIYTILVAGCLSCIRLLGIIRRSHPSMD